MVKDGDNWQAQTNFGYIIERTLTEKDAERSVRSKGLEYLTGVWQYYDKEDHDWFPCILKEAYEHKVVVIRTNVMGYQDPDDYKLVILEHPDESVLVKSS